MKCTFWLLACIPCVFSSPVLHGWLNTCIETDADFIGCSLGGTNVEETRSALDRSGVTVHSGYTTSTYAVQLSSDIRLWVTRHQKGSIIWRVLLLIKIQTRPTIIVWFCKQLVHWLTLTENSLWSRALKFPCNKGYTSVFPKYK